MRSFNNYINTITIYNSKLIAGGMFTTTGDVDAMRIASWEGASWAPLGSGINDEVFALTVHDSKLFAGGFFTEAGGAPPGAADTLVLELGIRVVPVLWHVRVDLVLPDDDQVHRLIDHAGQTHHLKDHETLGSAHPARRVDGRLLEGVEYLVSTHERSQVPTRRREVSGDDLTDSRKPQGRNHR